MGFVFDARDCNSCPVSAVSLLHERGSVLCAELSWSSMEGRALHGGIPSLLGSTGKHRESQGTIGKHREAQGSKSFEKVC